MALTNDEIRIALAAIPKQVGPAILQSVGFAERESGYDPREIRTRVRTMDPGPLHFLSWLLMATPSDGLSEAINVNQMKGDLRSIRDFNLAGPLRNGGLARWAQQWPIGIMRLILEAYWDKGALSLQERDELTKLLNDPKRLRASLADDEAMEPLTKPCPSPQYCRTREVLLGLTNREVRRLFATVPGELKKPILRSMGVQPTLTLKPPAIRDQIQMMEIAPLHHLMRLLAADPIESAGVITDQSDAAVGLRCGGLAKCAKRWRTGIARLVIETLWDAGMLSTDDRDELTTLLDDPNRLAASTLAKRFRVRSPN